MSGFRLGMIEAPWRLRGVAEGRVVVGLTPGESSWTGCTSGGVESAAGLGAGSPALNAGASLVGGVAASSGPERRSKWVSRQLGSEHERMTWRTTSNDMKGWSMNSRNVMNGGVAMSSCTSGVGVVAGGWGCPALGVVAMSWSAVGGAGQLLPWAIWAVVARVGCSHGSCAA